MSTEISFGCWVQRRRKALDLTQETLARRVGCAAETLRKIEADARRPSRQIAERLAEALELPAAERARFVQAARAELAVDRLAPPAQSITQISRLPTTGLPTGTVTFLFTDIEGSTRLWEQHPAAMREALAQHDTILRQIIVTHGGVVVKPTGDGLHAAFARAPDALGAALAAQRALQTERWELFAVPERQQSRIQTPRGRSKPKISVRMALHTGVAEERDGDYFGPPLNRAARLLATGHGGQTLLSLATAALVRDVLPPDVEICDLGVHRLKDLTCPEHIFQLVTPDLPASFPPLRTLDRPRTDLPVHPTPPIEREAEAVAASTLHLMDMHSVARNRLNEVGLDHPALQAAVELLDDCDDEVLFVAFKPSGHLDLASAILQALGIHKVGGRAFRERQRNDYSSRYVLSDCDSTTLSTGESASRTACDTIQ
jgi:class 3 adenylate cyclase